LFKFCCWTQGRAEERRDRERERKTHGRQPETIVDNAFTLTLTVAAAYVCGFPSCSFTPPVCQEVDALERAKVYKSKQQAFQAGKMLRINLKILMSNILLANMHTHTHILK